MTDVLSTWLLSVASETMADADAADVKAKLDRAGGTDAPGLEAAFEAARLIGIAGTPARVFAAAQDKPDASPVVAMAGLLMACFSAIRLDLVARPDATGVREILSALADSLYGAGDDVPADVIGFAAQVTGIAVDHVSATAATLAPVIRVETGLALPSSLLAFDLYGDPDRGAELVNRNGHRAPMLMPTEFEAVAR